MFDTPAKFVPDPVKVKVGDTIKWVNKGETIHTATSDPSQAPDASWASVPAGAETWDSGYLNGGEAQLHVQGSRDLPVLLHDAREGRNEGRNRCSAMRHYKSMHYWTATAADGDRWR